MKRYRTQVDGERFLMFNTVRECAISAAKAFQRHGWKWHNDFNDRIGHIPDEQEIILCLYSLRNDFEHSGRLLYHNNQYGHQESV